MAARSSRDSREDALRLVSLISLLYDVLLGLSLLFFQAQVVRFFELEPLRYPVNGNLNGLFALAVGLGYLAVIRDPWGQRWYLWLMGVVLKGAGVLVFAFDHWLRGGPASFLLFALADGLLALASLGVLIYSYRGSSHPAAPSP